MAVKSKTEDLEAFVAVVDSGSFSAAANLLDQQIAKVSRAVNRLESRLATTLLNRTTRRVELTEEGRVFLEYSRQCLQTLSQGEESLALLKSKPSGKLRIDAAGPFVTHQLTPLINDFCEAYPKIALDLTSHDSVIDLLEMRTDIAIRIGELADSNLHAKKLGSSKLYMVASPEYLSKRPLASIESLSEHRLIGFSNAQHLNLWPLKQAYKLNFSIHASNGETVRQLCLEGQGIALLSNFMIGEDLRCQRLVKLFEDQIISPHPRELVQAVYYRHSAVSARISAFLDFIDGRLTL